MYQQPPPTDMHYQTPPTDTHYQTPPTGMMPCYPPPPPLASNQPPQPGMHHQTAPTGMMQHYPPPPQLASNQPPPPGMHHQTAPTGMMQYYPQPPPPPASNQPLQTNQIVVVGPHFCSPYPVELTIAKKTLSITEGNFGVFDVNGNNIFKVKGTLLSVRDRRVLVDAAGVPLVSLQQKILSCHKRWQVYRGDSSDSKNLLFSVKKSNLLQIKTSLDVFLGSNDTAEEVCDFKIKGSYLERSCVIYQGNSKNIIAQMHKKHTVQSIVMGKDTYSITVYPNVDYAFIVALCVVLNEINMDRSEED